MGPKAQDDSTRSTRAVLEQLTGVHQLIGCLLYGTGMRLAECLRLRVKDLDFERNVVHVHEAKVGTKSPLDGMFDTSDDIELGIRTECLSHPTRAPKPNRMNWFLSVLFARVKSVVRK